MKLFEPFQVLLVCILLYRVLALSKSDHSTDVSEKIDLMKNLLFYTWGAENKKNFGSVNSDLAVAEFVANIYVAIKYFANRLLLCSVQNQEKPW
jgi:hypothetical protein